MAPLASRIPGDLAHHLRRLPHEGILRSRGMGDIQSMTLNLCQAGHESHDSMLIDTLYDPYNVWDWRQYKGQPLYCTGQDDVSMSLDLYGNWERPDIARMRDILTEKPGLVLDFGSHIGWFTIQALDLGCDVAAFDADPENMRLLLQTASEHMRPGEGWLTSTVNWVADIDPSGFDYDHVRFLKSDVEGAEDQVVKLTRHLFADRKIDHALLEISPVFKPYYPALVDELASYGYKPYIIKTEGDWEITGSDVTFPQENVFFSKRP